MKPILLSFLCREYEENGEIKKETKYTYSKLTNICAVSKQLLQNI